MTAIVIGLLIRISFGMIGFLVNLTLKNITNKNDTLPKIQKASFDTKLRKE